MKRKFTKTEIICADYSNRNPDGSPKQVKGFVPKRQNWRLREIYSLSDEDLLQFLEELKDCHSHPSWVVPIWIWNEAMCRGIHPKGQFDDWVRAERESNRGITHPQENRQRWQGLDLSIKGYVRYRKRREKFLARQKRMSKTDPKKPLRLIIVEETKPMDEK